MNINLQYSGTRLSGTHRFCPRGEGLTIALACVDALGAPTDLSGLTVVLGWDTHPTTATSRFESVGDSTGLASFSFTAADTFSMARRQTFDIWLETSLMERTEILDPSFVSISDAVAPITTAYYYHGVGVAGLSSVSTLTASGTKSFTASPSSQKVYFACPVVEGTPTITLDGWLVDVLPATTITVGTTDYYLLETTNLLTGASLPFVVSA